MKQCPELEIFRTVMTENISKVKFEAVGLSYYVKTEEKYIKYASKTLGYSLKNWERFLGIKG